MYNAHRGVPPGPQPGGNRLADLLEQVRQEFDQQAGRSSESEHQRKYTALDSGRSVQRLLYEYGPQANIIILCLFERLLIILMKCCWQYSITQTSNCNGTIMRLLFESAYRPLRFPHVFLTKNETNQL